MSNDITTAMSAIILKDYGIERLAEPDKLYVVMSHFVLPRTLPRPGWPRRVGSFVDTFGVRHYFEAGQGDRTRAVAG